MLRVHRYIPTKYIKPSGIRKQIALDFSSNRNGLFTWKFPSVPYNDGVIHTAGCEPDIMRWPGDIHYIWIRFIENTTCASHNAKTEDNIPHLHEQRFPLTSRVVPQNHDAPPLFHISQFTAGPKHCAWTDVTAKQKKYHIMPQRPARGCMCGICLCLRNKRQQSA